MPGPFNVNNIRSDFPILRVQAYGRDLAYFDNAATTQKPAVVIDTLTDYYSHYNANIHRGVHYLSQKASQAYDDVRVRVKEFINARSENEIIFTRGTTESINLVAFTYGERYIHEGDEIIITGMEHHSNIVPWQMLCERKKAVLKVVPLGNDGSIDLADLENMITGSTKLVSVVHTSNSLGTVNPVREICEIAHRNNVHVLVDAAQVMVHEPVDVQDLGCDFLAFSGHKMLGPTGVGCLYGKQELLETLPPYQGGGEMIQSVSFEKTTYNDIPFRFEAGTPNIADVIALGAAIDYLDGMDRKGARDHENDLLEYATTELQKVDGLRIYGTAAGKAPVVSFLVEGLNALDLGMYLDTKGVAVRTGHHCTEPVMNFFKIPGTLRASFLFYNTREEIDRLVNGLHGGIKLLRG
jgi:cysteine desulfurase/selenocysteine lyase